MKNFHHRVKKHYSYHKRFLPHYLGTSLVTIFITFAAYSVFPAKVEADNESLFNLDQSIEVSLWGAVSRESIEVVSNYDTPLTSSLQSGFYPLKKQLVIKPSDLLYPNANYEIVVKTKNLFGIKSEKKISVKTKPLPKVTLQTKIPEGGQLPVTTSIKFGLDQSLDPSFYAFTSTPNFPFDQKIESNSLIIKPKQKLTQGASYQFNLKLRSYTLSDKVLYEGQIAIIDPLLLTSSTPTNGQETVLKQSTIALTFNKAVDQTSFNSAFKVEPTTATNLAWTDEKSLTITPTAPLLTNTKYTLTLADSLRGTDGSQLPQTQTLIFTTAGPAKVSSFSPTGSAASTLASISVTFNQPVDQSSAQTNFSINPSVLGNFSWSGNSLIFKPQAALAAAATYTVTIAQGVKSVGGENSNQVFSSSFTTTSERTKTIGYSVKKRAITATYFGNGPKKILLVGTIHGSESNTGNMLTSWISYLRSNQSQIGSDRTFIIVPYLNPDGRASNYRFNANGVDLNRNWDLPDWQTLSYWQNRSYPNGGGSAPFSEPETRALRDLVYSENPAVSISYHSNANLILGDGIAQGLGDWYANLTGYTRSNSSGEESDVSALGYVITGTYEEWATKRGIPTLVVEFISQTANEYSHNLPALKGLLTYPI